MKKKAKIIPINQSAEEDIQEEDMIMNSLYNTLSDIDELIGDHLKTDNNENTV